jgi:hypothetical protein
MGKVKTTSEVIELAEILDDQPLLRHLQSLSIGDGIELEVAGVFGQWQRIAGGIEPVGDMKAAWLAIRQGPERTVPIGLGSSTYLATFEGRNRFWDIPESQIR